MEYICVKAFTPLPAIYTKLTIAYFTHDEALLKVSVDLSSSLGSFGAPL